MLCDSCALARAGFLNHPIYATHYGSRPVIRVREDQGAVRVHAHSGGGRLLQATVSSDPSVSSFTVVLLHATLLGGWSAVTATSCVVTDTSSFHVSLCFL